MIPQQGNLLLFVTHITEIKPSEKHKPSKSRVMEASPNRYGYKAIPTLKAQRTFPRWWVERLLREGISKFVRIHIHILVYILIQV